MNKNRNILDLIRTIDNMSEASRQSVLEELVVADPTLAKRLFRKVAGPNDKTVDVYLGSYTNKIRAIKAIRAVTGWGLADSKAFTEGTFAPTGKPYLLHANVSAENLVTIQREFLDSCSKLVTVPAGNTYIPETTPAQDWAERQ